MALSCLTTRALNETHTEDVQVRFGCADVATQG